MIIIDFDDTLFDNYKLKRLFIAAIGRCGVSEETYWDVYRSLRNDPINQIYTHERFANLLAQRGFEEAAILKALNSVATPENIKPLLFPDTISFLDALLNLKQPLILLSLGHPVYQQTKIDITNMKKWFKKIVIVDTKENALGELIRGVKDKSIWFINDRIKQTLDLLAIYPNLKCVLKHSVNGTLPEYQVSGLPHFETLTEIYEHIATNQ